MESEDPPSAVAERWRELLADADATAARYREDGWETLLVRPGDVATLDGDPFGLDVIAPDEEFEALEALVEEVTFDTSHVYRADENDVRLFVVVVESTADEIAIVVPAFFRTNEAGDLRARALEAGTMYTHVRPRSADARVTFTHDDPELFF